MEGRGDRMDRMDPLSVRFTSMTLNTNSGRQGKLDGWVVIWSHQLNLHHRLWVNWIEQMVPVSAGFTGLTITTGSWWAD